MKTTITIRNKQMQPMAKLEAYLLSSELLPKDYRNIKLALHRATEEKLPAGSEMWVVSELSTGHFMSRCGNPKAAVKEAKRIILEHSPPEMENTIKKKLELCK